MAQFELLAVAYDRSAAARLLGDGRICGERRTPGVRHSRVLRAAYGEVERLERATEDLVVGLVIVNPQESD